MTYQYSFKDLLQRAERIDWRVEDLIGDDKTLDFSMPFMPESLARTAELAFLGTDEKRMLNQIRGHAYLAIFGVVEEFILPFVVEHARPYLTGEEYRARAYLEFAAEEAKHIHLFRRFRHAFAEGFATPCDVLGPSADIAANVPSRPALSVALLTLHIEWMTQRHFLESVKDDAAIDPQFKSLLFHHWMEEHQHAQLDAMMVRSIAADPAKGATHWRVASAWRERMHSRAQVDGFAIGGQAVQRTFAFETDEPLQLGGANGFANPQEYLLGALNACLIAGFSALCALHGYAIERLEVVTEGDIDLSGFLGLDGPVSPGHDGLKTTLTVEGSASPDDFRKVFDMAVATSPNVHNIRRPVVLTTELAVIA